MEECLDVVVDLQADQAEDKDDGGASLKELLAQVDRHERRCQPNVESQLEVNLGIVAIRGKLKVKLKNRI